MFCLDSNTIIFAIRHKSIYRSKVLKRLSEIDPKEIAIPAVVRAELVHGATKSAHREENLKALALFLSPFEILPFDKTASDYYGEIRTSLELSGTLISPADLFIAATTKSVGATLVTNNTREFTRVDGLQIEDWTD